MAVGARLFRLGELEFWSDEAFTANAIMRPYDQMMEVIKKDSAPPLHYWVLHYWMQLFELNEFQARLPSVLAGCLSMLVYWKLSKICFHSPLSRLLSYSLYCFNPLIITFDRTARMYAIQNLCSLLLLLTLLQIFNKTDKATTYLLLFIGNLLGLLCFNLFCLVSLIVLLLILWYGNNTQRLNTLITYFITGLCYLPIFLSVVLTQIKSINQSYLY